MALQDLVPFDPRKMIDPKTGEPFEYGTPEYNAAIGDSLSNQLHREAQRTSNARGMFYSGPAMADEQQAASNLLYQMTQQGAQQALQEREMLQNQQFQAQQQAAQNQAAMDAARVQGKEAQKAAAIQGGMGAAGTLGGLYAMNKFGLMGGAGLGGAGEQAAIPTYNALMAGGGYDPAAAAHAAEYVAGGSAAPGVGGGGAAGGAAAGAGGAPATLPMYNTLTGTSSGLGALGVGLLGAGAGYGGSQLGGHHNGTAASAGSATGGALGAGIGGILGGPLGFIGGSGLGSFLGGHLGDFFGGLF